MRIRRPNQNFGAIDNGCLPFGLLILARILQGDRNLGGQHCLNLNILLRKAIYFRGLHIKHANQLAAGNHWYSHLRLRLRQ